MRRLALFVFLAFACARTFAAASDDWYAPELIALADTDPEEAHAATPPPVESPISTDYLKLVWADTVETATGPVH